MTDIVGGNDDVLKPAVTQIIDIPSVADVNPLLDMNNAPRTLPRQLVSGNSRGIQQLGTPNLYIDSGNEQIIAAPDSLPQVLMGKQPTFGEGFFVTKPGIDVTKATSPNDFILNSNQNTLKIVDSGTVVLPGFRFTTPANQYATGQSQAVVTHDLGFVPAIIAYAASADGTEYQALPIIGDGVFSGGFIQFNSQITIDSTNIYIFYNVFGYNYVGGYTLNNLTILYYLLQETAKS